VLQACEAELGKLTQWATQIQASETAAEVIHGCQVAAAEFLDRVAAAEEPTE
jgi:hypothetical protein